MHTREVILEISDQIAGVGLEQFTDRLEIMQALDLRPICRLSEALDNRAAFECMFTVSQLETCFFNDAEFRVCYLSYDSL